MGRDSLQYLRGELPRKSLDSCGSGLVGGGSGCCWPRVGARIAVILRETKRIEGGMLSMLA